MTYRVWRGAAAMALVLAAAVAGAGACRKSKPALPDKDSDGPNLVPQSNEDLSATLAKVDDVVITVKQLQDSINRQSPYIRARYTSKEQKRTFLDNMVRFEVLAREATRRGLDKDPEVIQTMKSAMITKLLRAELASGVKPDDIPEADLRRFFDDNPERWNRPEEVRVSAIVLAKKKQADDVARLALGPDGQSNKAFRELVARFSVDQESKLRGGDLRYFARDTTEVPRPVVDAAFKLERTGDVAGPIEADKKFYVIKQTGRRSPVQKSFDQVKREIQNELYKQRRDGAQKQLVDQLRTRSKIEVFDENLKKVRVDTSSRAGADPSAGEPGTGEPP
jgi:peptidyl-prolyl cis-trans isomerase C